MEYQEVTLATINNGAALEMFEEELAKVLENIADPSTPPEAVREIRLVFKIKPSEDRSRAETEIQPSVKLASIKAHAHFVTFGNDGQRTHAYVANPKQNTLPFEGGKTGKEAASK